MYEKEFKTRLSQLRSLKGVSARDMSLSIGQNPGYINNIESGKALPSMSAFFYICEYLNITPKDFFEYDTKRSDENLSNTIHQLKRLTSEEYDSIALIISELSQKK